MASPAFVRRLAGLFPRPRRAPVTPRRPARLGVEALETRTVPDGAVSGNLWVDVDVDGVRDSYEPGLPGVLVEMFASDWSVAASGTTDADGYYLVTGVPDDSYNGCFTLPGGGSFAFWYAGSGMTSTYYPMGVGATVDLAVYAPPQVSVAALDDATEGGGDGAFLFSRTGDLSSALTVSYAVVTAGAGAATPGADYTALSGTVTIPAYAETVEVPVVAATDALAEDAEWVSVAVSAGTGYTVASEPAAINVIDTTCVVSVAGVKVAREGGPDGVLRFTRTGDLTDPLSVAYTVVDVGPSMATPGGDYATLSGTVTIPAGSAVADVGVTAFADGYAEQVEFVNVVLTESTAYTIGTGTGEVTIPAGGGRLVVWVSEDDGTWDDPENWNIQEVPAADDEVYFVDAAGAAEIGSAEWGTGNMTGFGSLSGAQSYAGMHLLGYPSVVSLTLPFTAGKLTMEAPGTIDQPNGLGSELTATERFRWTEGTINASAAASNLNVSGAVAEIEPLNQGTLYLGSTLNVVDGAFATIQSGVIALTGGYGVYVRAAVTSWYATNGPLTIQMHNQVTVGTAVSIASTGTVALSRGGGTGGASITFNIPVVNHLGVFLMTAGVECTVNRPAELGPGFSFVQYGGATEVSFGTRLIVPQCYNMLGGDIQITPTSEDGEFEFIGSLNFNAHRESRIYFVYPPIQSGPPNLLGCAGKFHVLGGNVTWNNGSFVGRADGSNASRAWWWDIEGTLKIAPRSGECPRVFVEMSNPTAAPSGREWTIIKAGGKVSGPLLTFVGNGNETVSPNNHVLRLNTNETQYSVKKN